MTVTSWCTTSIRKLINWNSCSTVHVFLCFMFCAVICSIVRISDWLFVCSLIFLHLCVCKSSCGCQLGINKQKWWWWPTQLTWPDTLGWAIWTGYKMARYRDFLETGVSISLHELDELSSSASSLTADSAADTTATAAGLACVSRSAAFASCSLCHITCQQYD